MTTARTRKSELLLCSPCCPCSSHSVEEGDVISRGVHAGGRDSGEKRAQRSGCMQRPREAKGLRSVRPLDANSFLHACCIRARGYFQSLAELKSRAPQRGVQAGARLRRRVGRFRRHLE